MSSAYGPHGSDDEQTAADMQNTEGAAASGDARAAGPAQPQDPATAAWAQQLGGPGAHPGQDAYPGQGAYPGQVPYGYPQGYGAIPPPPPPPPWAAPGYGGQPAGPPQRSHRRALGLVAGAAAVALAAGGTAWATVGSASSPLTTSAIAAKTDPGLVDVISTLGYEHGTAEGTGMVLTPNGEILTNNHVVAGSTSIKVRDIGNGRTYTAKVVGYSDSNDVAVLKLAGASGLTTITTGDSSAVAVGQKVVALGNAGGKDGTPSVATGTVTGTGTTITAEDSGDGVLEHLNDMIRTNADIQPGDSGGSLVNSAGEVVGMDTAASSSSTGGYGTTSAQSVTAFSIPINKALSIVHQIEAGKSSGTVHIGATAFLGVEVSSAASGSSGFGQTSSGVVIAGSVQGTAAASAGIGAGDTIVSVGGHQITSDSDLQQVIEGYHPGDKVTVTWTDQLGQTHTATVTLTAGPTG